MASIFTVKIPDLVITISEEQKMDFVAFVRWTLATHSSYNTDAAGIRAAFRLERKFESNCLPSSFDLDSEDIQRLRKAVESPQGGYPIRPAFKMLLFVEAIVNAEQKD
jgi:hypothetical protein